MMELSILVATVSPRANLVSRLLANLQDQVRYEPEVEVLVHRSDTKGLGQKYNELRRAANGRLSVEVDDDDQVAADYVATVLDNSQGADFVGYKVMYTVNGDLQGRTIYEIDPPRARHVRYGGPERVRHVSAKCPVLTEHARRFALGDYVGSDWVWTEDLIRDGFPHDPVFVDRTLYWYDCWPEHALGGRPEEWREQRQFESIPYDRSCFTWIE